MHPVSKPLSLLCNLLALASSPAATAGQTATDSACTYERCALWIDGTTVRRGAVGTVVLRDGLFRPMRLRADVDTHDSAAAWAEKRARIGQSLGVAGLAAVIVGFGAQYIRVHKSAERHR